MMKFKIFLGFVLLYSLGFTQNYRYTNTLFDSSSSVDNITYTNVPNLTTPTVVESSVQMTDMKMDIFSPDNDNFNTRPAIVFIHGGGFITGNKNHDDMMAFCDIFARKGYVTATIDYRQGFNVVDNVELHAIRASYRGIQDGRSAVRYLRANASAYGIDASKIYMVGSSAGAIIGLHDIYINDENEIPAETGSVNYTNGIFPFLHTTPDLGPLDIGENLTLNGKPDAVVSMWGSIQNLSLIKENDKIPVLLIHGTADAIVSFNEGSAFNYPGFPVVYGSNLIKNRLNELNINNYETYFEEGQPHEFYGVLNGAWLNGGSGNAYWPIIVDRITQFLWRQHKPTALFSYTKTENVATFTDNSIGAESWLWDFGDGTTSTEQNPVHTYVNAGDYDVVLYVENDILSWDHSTQSINFANTLSTVDFNSSLSGIKIYPNPVKNDIFLNLNSNFEAFDYKIYSISGAKITEGQFKKSNIYIPFENYSNGVYFINIKIKNRERTIKFIKNN